MPSPPTERHRRSRRLLLLAALLASAGAPRAQESPAPAGAVPESSPAAPAAPAAPDAAPHDPAAAAEQARLAAEEAARALGAQVLERAARFQRGDRGPQAPPSSLHGRFHVGARDADGSLIQAEVERWFTVSPERMLTRRTEVVTGSTALLGWNGTTAWFRDEADKRVIRYTDAPETFLTDLEELQHQVRLTRLLLTASVMDALRPRLTDVIATGQRDVTDLDGVRHATDLVTARIADELYPAPAGGPPPKPGAPPRQLELRFAIDRETGALRELRVTALERPGIAPLRLAFDYHGPTASGLRVPGNIRVYEGTETRESIVLGVEQPAPADLLLFDVDVPIDAALFDPPAE